MRKSTGKSVREISPCGRRSNFYGMPVAGAYLGDGADCEPMNVPRDFARCEPTNERTRQPLLHTFSGPSGSPNEARNRRRRGMFRRACRSTSNRRRALRLKFRIRRALRPPWRPGRRNIVDRRGSGNICLRFCFGGFAFNEPALALCASGPGVGQTRPRHRPQQKQVYQQRARHGTQNVVLCSGRGPGTEHSTKCCVSGRRRSGTFLCSGTSIAQPCVIS